MALVSIRNNLYRASVGKIHENDEAVFIALQDVFKRFPIHLQDYKLQLLVIMVVLIVVDLEVVTLVSPLIFVQIYYLLLLLQQELQCFT